MIEALLIFIAFVCGCVAGRFLAPEEDKLIADLKAEIARLKAKP